MTGLRSSHAEGLKGVARVPGDKALSHRGLMLGAIASGETQIQGLFEGDDVLRTAQALSALGALVTPPAAPGEFWRIAPPPQGNFSSPRLSVYLGASASSARLLMGLLAGYPLTVFLTGDDTLIARPMGRAIKPLSQMGAQFETVMADRLPLKITGQFPLRSVHYDAPAASAHVKSAVLLAALRARGRTTVVEPYATRDHTERMLSFFGASVSTDRRANGSCAVSVDGGATLKGCMVPIPADPGLAVFIAVCALVTPGSDILIPGVCVNPLRMGAFETLQHMGGDLSFSPPRTKGGELAADLRVRYSPLRGVVVPRDRMLLMFDELAALCVAAVHAEGRTVLQGLSDLHLKDGDRVKAAAAAFMATGAGISAGPDSVEIDGAAGPLPGGCSVTTGHDYRLGMAMLALGLTARAPVAIDAGQEIDRQFPGFVTLINALGGQIQPIITQI